MYKPLNEGQSRLPQWLATICFQVSRKCATEILAERNSKRSSRRNPEPSRPERPVLDPSSITEKFVQRQFSYSLKTWHWNRINCCTSRARHDLDARDRGEIFPSCKALKFHDTAKDSRFCAMPRAAGPAAAQLRRRLPPRGERREPANVGGGGGLGEFLGDAVDSLAPVDLVEDVLRGDAALGPHHG
jgi:hypothetical protein